MIVMRCQAHASAGGAVSDVCQAKPLKISLQADGAERLSNKNINGFMQSSGKVREMDCQP